MQVVRKSRYKSFVNFPDFEQVTITLPNSLDNDSTSLETLGPNLLPGSCRHKNTFGNSIPEGVMLYCAV